MGGRFVCCTVVNLKMEGPFSFVYQIGPGSISTDGAGDKPSTLIKVSNLNIFWYLLVEQQICLQFKDTRFYMQSVLIIKMILKFMKTLMIVIKCRYPSRA